MNQKDIINKVSENTNFNKYAVKEIIDSYNQILLSQLIKEQSITIPGLKCKISIKKQKKKTIQSFDGQSIETNDYFIPSISFSKTAKLAINSYLNQDEEEL